MSYEVGSKRILAEMREIAKLAMPPSAAAVRNNPLPDGAAIKRMMVVMAQRPTTKQLEAYLRLVSTARRERNE